MDRAENELSKKDATKKPVNFCKRNLHQKFSLRLRVQNHFASPRLRVKKPLAPLHLLSIFEL